MSVRFVFEHSHKHPGNWQHCLGTQLWWDLEMWWQLRWWQDSTFLCHFPFFFLFSHQHSETMSSVDMQKHTVQWCYGVTVKSQACLLVRADSRETLTDPQLSPWWLYFFSRHFKSHSFDSLFSPNNTCLMFSIPICLFPLVSGKALQ